MIGLQFNFKTYAIRSSSFDFVDNFLGCLGVPELTVVRLGVAMLGLCDLKIQGPSLCYQIWAVQWFILMLSQGKNVTTG